MVLIYNYKLKFRAREYRKNQTKAEGLLWKKIRGRKIKGYQFLRQVVIENYIVDFLCMKLKLIIEIDGLIHIQNKEIDRFRQGELESLGFRFLRFTNSEIEKNINSVIKRIEKSI